MNYFINEALTKALNSYIDYRKDSSKNVDFLTYIIITLKYIYGENDVVNPYLNKDFQTFNKNLTKYGYKKQQLVAFYNNIKSFDEENSQNLKKHTSLKNIYFTLIQKDLIDMFICKYVTLKLNKEEVITFSKYIFSTHSSIGRQEYNLLYTSNPDEAYDYLIKKVYEIEHHIIDKKKKVNLLNQSIYDALGLSKEDIENLTQTDLDYINNDIYNYYKMSPIEPDLDNKLLKAIKKNERGINKRLSKGNKLFNIIFFIIIMIVITIVIVVLARYLLGNR